MNYRSILLLLAVAISLVAAEQCPANTESCTLPNGDVGVFMYRPTDPSQLQQPRKQQSSSRRLGHSHHHQEKPKASTKRRQNRHGVHRFHFGMSSTQCVPQNLVEDASEHLACGCAGGVCPEMLQCGCGCDITNHKGDVLAAGDGVWVSITTTSDNTVQKCVRPEYAEPSRVQCVQECPMA
ncbi:expressed unknown protein [Seminavis robusta]|uniref:Uncharacterized protein n=1 Tax=Seminavis robusta TaxID=568900 RepID=A0A9N8E5F1_9STRA|nr:expressed unknown protein [Seminavis robusta]|eukprot:Sro567_g168000.1 n/a (181) ;mRNA; f:32609-33151